MYQTIAEARDRTELGLISSGDYPDSVVTSLLLKTQAIVNGYLGQSIAYSETTDKILVTPNLESGVTAILKRRFVNAISNFEIEYGYNMANIVIGSGDYFLNEEAGYVETYYGALPPYLFTNENNRKYKAVITYTAGFQTLPEEFIEAFYIIMQKVVDNYRALINPEDLTPMSNKIKSYKTLNESMTFEEDAAFNTLGDQVVLDSVSLILDNYAITRVGMGRFM